MSQTFNSDTARGRLAALFDVVFYRAEAKIDEQADAFAHYLRHGAALRPNPIFDPTWYSAQNPDAAKTNPLLHYALIGEAADRDPSPLFDVAWYRRTYSAEAPLAHYLARRFGPFSPVPEFDAAFYLAANPDVAQAGLDPFQHYLHFGWRDFRKPSESFNPRLYANRHMGADRNSNPLLHLRAHGAPPPSPPRAGPFEAARRFSRPGPRFEPLAAPAQGDPRALALAFHLPQFHQIGENDEWWGEGFTEWTLLARGQSRFEGHYQPRVPGSSLGFYDLLDMGTLAAQATMAREAGIGAFVFYHYDFGGRRLLERPVDDFLKRSDIDIGFCLMWANENWTRRWDGADEETLVQQDYDSAHEAARLADFARHMRDPRYVRLQGRPLLMIYRASLIPETATTLARWRRRFLDEHGEQPIFILAQTFADLDPRPLGCDAAIEFPPHKLTQRLPQVFASLDVHDESFEADVYAYDDVVAASLSEAAPDYDLIKTAVPSWDNDARRQGQGLTLVGATPLKYERWLSGMLARARPVFGARIVAINAWNEWSEGAYLEPDLFLGAACLNATARALRGAPPLPVSEIAKVSAFVLHEDGPFPSMRLRSVFAQTHPIAEVIVLDVGENSLQAVEAEAGAAGRDVTLGLGVSDAFGQIAVRASGEFVWIVASEGRSDFGALAALAQALANTPRAAFAFCDSASLDGEGQLLHVRPDPFAHPRRVVAFTDRVFDAAQFLAAVAKAGAPELSAILWRRDALVGALAALPDHDRIAVNLCRANLGLPGARVAFVADTLDYTSSRS